MFRSERLRSGYETLPRQSQVALLMQGLFFMPHCFCGRALIHSHASLVLRALPVHGTGSRVSVIA